MRRADEIFSANRNRVIKRSVVGKTLKSTGLTMYNDTSKTITESVRFVLIKMSSRNGGNGAIIASTMPSTAKGTAMSTRRAKRKLDGRAAFKLDAIGCGVTVGRFE